MYRRPALFHHFLFIKILACIIGCMNQARCWIITRTDHSFSSIWTPFLVFSSWATFDWTTIEFHSYISFFISKFSNANLPTSWRQQLFQPILIDWNNCCRRQLFFFGELAPLSVCPFLVATSYQCGLSVSSIFIQSRSCYDCLILSVSM